MFNLATLVFNQYRLSFSCLISAPGRVVEAFSGYHILERGVRGALLLKYRFRQLQCVIRIQPMLR